MITRTPESSFFIFSLSIKISASLLTTNFFFRRLQLQSMHCGGTTASVAYSVRHSGTVLPGDTAAKHQWLTSQLQWWQRQRQHLQFHARHGKRGREPREHAGRQIFQHLHARVPPRVVCMGQLLSVQNIPPSLRNAEPAPLWILHPHSLPVFASPGPFNSLLSNPVWSRGVYRGLCVAQKEQSVWRSQWPLIILKKEDLFLNRAAKEWFLLIYESCDCVIIWSHSFH